MSIDYPIYSSKIKILLKLKNKYIRFYNEDFTMTKIQDSLEKKGKKWIRY